MVKSKILGIARRLFDGKCADWPNLSLTHCLNVAPSTLFLSNVEITYFVRRESQDPAFFPFRLVLQGKPVYQTSYDFELGMALVEGLERTSVS
jgi:hypothetical protein